MMVTPGPNFFNIRFPQDLTREANSLNNPPSHPYLTSVGNLHNSSMESSSSEFGLSRWDYLNLILLRPALAIAFVFLVIFLGWLLAWKLVLVHVPLVQEIFGLRKKPTQPKPPIRRRLSKIYSNIESHNSPP